MSGFLMAAHALEEETEGQGFVQPWGDEQTPHLEEALLQSTPICGKVDEKM